MEMSNFVDTAEQAERLNTMIQRHLSKDSSVIQVLHDAQEIYGYLPLEVQRTISEAMDIPLADIFGVVSFYSQFSMTPKGKYRISVCTGTVCYVKNSNDILDKFKELLSIDVNECTEDGLFSLDACRCIGACGLAPVVTINDEVYGKLTADDVAGIISKYTKAEGTP